MRHEIVPCRTQPILLRSPKLKPMIVVFFDRLRPRVLLRFKLSRLVEQWNKDPNYSYGFFVSNRVGDTWSRRTDRFDANPGQLVGILAADSLAVATDSALRLERAVRGNRDDPAGCGSVVFAVGGGHLLRVMLPAVLFLAFMLPLPPSFNAAARKAASIGRHAWQRDALATARRSRPRRRQRDSHGETPLEVARACNGLSMLLSFVTLIVATCSWFLAPGPSGSSCSCRRADRHHD